MLGKMTALKKFPIEFLGNQFQQVFSQKKNQSMSALQAFSKILHKTYLTEYYNKKLKFCFSLVGMIQPISHQCFRFIHPEPPEKLWFSGVFREYKMGTGLEACSFIKKETLAQIFSCKFCKIFKKTFFTEHLRTTTSVFSATTIQEIFIDKTIL